MIEARNFRSGGVEVDVLAWEDATLVFIEVRSRTGRRFGSPLETVGARKQLRIARAAAVYLARFRGLPPPVRFDVVGVVWGGGGPEFELVRGAFGSPL